MSLRTGAFSSAASIITSEETAPILRKITDLLLRSGGVGYLNLKRQLHKGCDDDKRSKLKKRINPVTFKSILVECGVLLTPAEYGHLRVAFSDEGGLLFEDFLNHVCPLRYVGEDCVFKLMGMFSDYNSQPTVPLNVLLHSLEDALVTKGDTSQVGESPIITSALLEIKIAFDKINYPMGYVPARDVLSFLAAILLNAADEAIVIMERLATVDLSPEAIVVEPAHSTSLISRSLCRKERGFDYYTESDNKDEWLRGREERPPGEMYQKFLPGYTGHIPTYKSKFGRSFHAIEESAPALTQPRKPLEPVPKDRYGPGVELKDNRMSRHNFKLA